MTIRIRLRPATLASALGLATLAGCIGASDDRLGSGNTSKSGGSGIDDGTPIDTATQRNRQDAGDPSLTSDPNGTARPDDANATRTGGLGGIRDNKPPGPGETGPRSSSGVASGPK